MIENFEDEIRYLQKTRSVLELVKQTTSRIHEDLKSITENHAQLKKVSKETLEQVKSIDQ